MARSCDTCARLKYKCSQAHGSDACGRCTRLGLGCTWNRPTPRRGRPPKAQDDGTNQAPAEAQVSHNRTMRSAALIEATLDSNSPTLVQRVLSRSRELPVDESYATRLMEQLLVNINHIGLLSFFHDRLDQLDSLHDDILCPSLVLALLAFAVRLDSDGRDQSLLAAEESCMYALSDIPILTWKDGPLRIGDAYSLAILSSLSYLSSTASGIAERWSGLSIVILDEVKANTNAHGTQDQRKTIEYVSVLVQLNSLIRGLLYYNQPVTLPTFEADAAASTPEANVGMPVPNLPGSKTGFRGLFLPLLPILRNALSQSPQSRVSQKSRDSNLRALEMYYINFPESLMTISSVNLVYQLEAMIWLHGIHQLLYGAQDPIDILYNQAWHNASDYVGAIEHAILMGEILPQLEQVGTGLIGSISPATIAFISISAAILCSLAIQSGSSTSHPSLHTSLQSYASIIGMFTNSDWTHGHHFFDGIRELTGAVLNGLETPGLTLVVEKLKYYRWVKGGTGLRRLGDESSQILYTKSTSLQNQLSVDPAIIRKCLELFDQQRLTPAGTFELSLRLQW